ncbi:MAG: hypothetical protein MJ059_01315 [Lachnospiraceae bacterium]|nr:hypothetical protein [Lachnospiraceae bacterium]
MDFFNDIIEAVRRDLNYSKGNEITVKLKEDIDEYVKIRDKWMNALEKSVGVGGRWLRG